MASKVCVKTREKKIAGVLRKNAGLSSRPESACHDHMSYLPANQANVVRREGGPEREKSIEESIIHRAGMAKRIVKSSKEMCPTHRQKSPTSGGGKTQKNEGGEKGVARQSQSGAGRR